jgi:hypothetical protein
VDARWRRERWRKFNTMTDSISRPAPPPGIYVQVWLGAIKASSRGERLKKLAEFCRHAKRSGVTGIVAHGFPRGMARDWDVLAPTITDEGLLACASVGLDGRRDEDGTTLTVQEKGDLVGALAAETTCAGVWLDAEGRWDRDEKPADDMNEAGALAFGKALRAAAPTAWVADQPWPILDVHGDVRRTARPIENGGVLTGFPADEFAASCVNGDRAVQLYWANWRAQWDDAAYEKLVTWHMRSWAAANEALTRAGLGRTLAATIQGYGHEATSASIHDVMHAVLTYAVERQTRLVVWSEPFPTRVVMQVLAAAADLIHRQFARPSETPETVIRRLQSALNVTVDGKYGLGTQKAHGFDAPAFNERIFGTH